MISSSLAFLFTYIPQGWWALPPGSVTSHLPPAPSPLPLTSGVPLHPSPGPSGTPAVHAQLTPAFVLPAATTVTLEESRKGLQAGRLLQSTRGFSPNPNQCLCGFPGPVCLTFQILLSDSGICGVQSWVLYGVHLSVISPAQSGCVSLFCRGGN